MAAAGRAIVQAVRPHAPLIKFPNRHGIPTPDAQEVLKIGVTAGQQSSGTHSLPPSSAPAATPVSWLPAAPDTAASVGALPPRYRRRIVSPEEMDWIQRGGPE